MPSTSTPHDLRSGAAFLCSETREVQEKFLQELSDEASSALPFLFEFWALDHQLPPEGDWRSWVIMGGRGAGKTRAGAEWVRSMVEGALPMDAGRARRVALVGETFDQVRDVMIFGDSGILACSPPDRRPRWNATRRRLEWQNGAVAEAHSASSPEGMRGPQFDAAWVDELGCAAIDKGPNQPNKFLDPKSSESGIPHYSTGRRDDEVQMQYLRAYFDLFSQEAMNPVSGVYGGPMVDMSRAFVWAWDARPWPDFPNNLGYWSDGGNHITGHWLTGRSATQPLSRVVAQLCERTGVRNYDVSELNGIVRGYALSDLETSRASLQPLMVAYGFDAIERGGVLVFRNRDSAVEWDLDDQSVAIDGDAARFEHLRAPSPEVMGDVRLSYVEADGEFAARVAQARLADDAALDSSQNDLALALTDAEARGISERWLSEARIARDTVQFALPPSRGEVQAGDLVRLDEGALFRVDRIEDRGARSVEAVRVERQIYAPSDAVETLPEVRPFTTPTPVAAQFMDLPLLSGDEVAHAPHLAISADPWPGSAAVYSAPQDAGYALNSLIERPAVMGVTQTSLARAAAGLWSRGPVLRVALASGALSSRDEMSVLNGANAAALGDGTSDHWEVFQFTTADLVAPGVYDLSGLLRGQAGSDGIMPDLWPVGSRFVLLDGGPVQIEQDIAARDLARHFRVGPALRPFDDASYRHYVEAFKGNGLRPYSPAHLKARRVGEAFEFSWTRRTRIDGDSWASVDVPLGEDTESYVLRVLQAEQILREETLASAQWNYTAAMRTADGITGSFAVEVAQMSMRFGPGPYSRIELDD